MKIPRWIPAVLIVAVLSAAAVFVVLKFVIGTEGGKISSNQFPSGLNSLPQPPAMKIREVNGMQKEEGCNTMVIGYDQLLQKQNYQENEKNDFVEKNLFVVLEGWIYDPVSRTPASEVFVDLGYKSYPVDYGFARKDLKTGPLRNTGFKCLIPLSDLFYSPKKIHLKVINAARTGFYESETYTISVLKRRFVSMNGIPQNIEKTRHVVDEIQGEPFSEETVYTNYRTPFFTVKGWAVDDLSDGPAGGFYVSVDNMAFFPAAYGFERMDVVRAFDKYQFLFSGYEVCIPTTNIPDGLHLLNFWVIGQKLNMCHLSALKAQFYITNTNVQPLSNFIEIPTSSAGVTNP